MPKRPDPFGGDDEMRQRYYDAADFGDAPYSPEDDESEAALQNAADELEAEIDRQNADE
jgi:hypothetical protein